ncbi:MAG: hypothetical protein A3G41_04265 [Elusimicrobia bacterium RIFCSPLOWO2_12_FULL_59_9]|nr:MAG: hypothetical protein A3G41_04265 [Elusimicrobia bacterium RIFCSPLOWO2_12_FULL_59_9]
MKDNNSRIALVHDFLVHVRGGEKTFLALHELYPTAPVYVLVANRNKVTELNGMDIRESFVGKLPFARRHFRSFLLLYPLATESFDLSTYDLVISSSALFVKNVRVGPRTCHICYCHTPNRHLWNDAAEATAPEANARLGSLLLPPVLDYLRRWDESCSHRVDYFVANSKTTALRIARYYGRTAEVIHPPVDVDFFSPSNDYQDYFLVVAHLVPYKRVDLAVWAFASLRDRLVIVGKGPEWGRLHHLAGPNVTFLGSVSPERLRSLYERCRALIVPTLEDFGIATVEAQACGKPVIAYRGGGSTEIVLEGQTGVFFEEQTWESLLAALERFKQMHFNPLDIRTNAERFSKDVFRERIRTFVEAKLAEFQNGRNRRGEGRGPAHPAMRHQGGRER